MRADSALWEQLTNLNAIADGLISKVTRSVEPTEPISREIPFEASIEVRFDRLPTALENALPLASDLAWGNNVKRGIFSNNGSRVYVRELAFSQYFVNPTTDARLPYSFDGAAEELDFGEFPPNWRWNYSTSITQKKYSDLFVSNGGGGRVETGNHLSAKDPLVIEPRETFIFDCQLLNYMGPSASFVVAMYLAGYREAM